jgi:hypothetical protein
MPIDPEDPKSWFTTAVTEYVTAYFEEEDNFGALRLNNPDETRETIDEFALVLAGAVHCYRFFEEGEPPTAFNDIARRVMGLPSAAGPDAEPDPDPDRTARIRDAARLELRLEELAAAIMYQGLPDESDALVDDLIPIDLLQEIMPDVELSPSNPRGGRRLRERMSGRWLVMGWSRRAAHRQPSESASRGQPSAAGSLPATSGLTKGGSG